MTGGIFCELEHPGVGCCRRGMQQQHGRSGCDCRRHRGLVIRVSREHITGQACVGQGLGNRVSRKTVCGRVRDQNPDGFRGLRYCSRASVRHTFGGWGAVVAW